MIRAETMQTVRQRFGAKGSIKRLARFLLLSLALPWSIHGAGAAGLQLGPFERTRPKTLAVASGPQPFDEHDALHGSLADEALCRSIPDALWLESGAGGHCIRVYSAGAKREAGRAIVYFSGDAMLRSRSGVRSIGASYLRRSPDGIRADMRDWHRQAGIPVMFVARPGLYGSSGDHNQRRLPDEIEILDAALDQLKARHGIGSFILVGQSGGGHVVAALLSRRSDVHAAVVSSGLLSVKRVMQVWDRRRTVPGWLMQDETRFVDPVDEVEAIAHPPPGGIHVLSDPEDTVIPFSTQLHYVRRLRSAGLSPYHFYARASDPARHALFPQAQATASLLARGADAASVLDMLQGLEREAFGSPAAR